jgi:hypothetical protein
MEKERLEYEKEQGVMSNNLLILHENLREMHWQPHLENAQGVLFGANLTEIKSRTFEKAKGLEALILPATLRYIDDFAFNDCENLTQVVIPKEIIKIGKGVFDNCKKLGRILVIDAEPYYLQRIKKMLPVELHSRVRGVSLISIKDAERVRNEAKSEILNDYVLTHPASSSWPTVFLPAELTKTIMQEAGVSKKIEKQLEAWLQMIPIPEHNNAVSLEAYKKALDAYKNAIEKHALKYQLQQISEQIQRKSKTHPTLEKAMAISCLIKSLEGDVDKHISKRYADILLGEGKGRIKRLLQKFMPEIKKELEVLASSEQPQEASAAPIQP